MSFTNDVVAGLSLGLVSPAVVFVAALFLRSIQPFEAAPARTGDRVLRWFSDHPQLGLWVLLLLLPLTAFVLGSSALLRTWDNNPQLQAFTWRALAAIPAHLPAFLIAVATILSAAVLTLIARQLMRGSGQ